ncbi:MAG TPA: PQQ-binding-like beta-propeller repeat protein, partial [Candidatus Polarisedimenticolia bacterium]|nr:PQQ-binding-like beta-propeller repeat protein [Candidatus Polarisedimenticolia bacterium]
LREAARTGDVKQVRSLLEAGVPVDAPAPRHGNTALMFAAGHGHTDVVRLLLDKGANVNARESFFGATPLSEAIRGEHFPLAILLLERGAAGAAEALAAAIERDNLDLGRAAVATGRFSPLELKAAKKLAETESKGDFQKLLADVTAPKSERRPFPLTPEKLQRYAGKYRTPAGEAAVAVKGGGLALTGVGPAEIVLEPLKEDYFETAAGDASLEFGGRGGIIEWAQVNRDGEITSLNLSATTPQPLKTAEAPDTGVGAPKGEARPWPQFRGPAASGIGDGQGIPATWNLTTKENIRFKTEVPGISLSSPIMWGDRIFVSTAISAAGDRTFRTGLYGDPTSVDDLSEHSFKLYALDAKSGAIVWEREVHRAKPTVRRHLKSSLANATPATDGKRVVVLFGSIGLLAAYDFSGQKLWEKEIGILDCNDPQAGDAEWGHASSPILHGDLILVQGDRRKDSFVAAYKIETGEQVWRVPREEPSTWATPNILPATTGDELVTNGHVIRAYEPKTGKLLWTLSPNSEVVVATPVVGDGKVFITAGYPPIRPIYAVRPGQRGDLTLPEGKSESPAIAWSHERGGTYLPTPLLYRGHLYLVNNNGILTCYRADTGEMVYQTRIGEVGVSFSSSPIAADGRIYFASESGDVYVLRAGPSFELLATNAMDEVVMATPAVSDGLLVVRTLGHVVGIGPPLVAAR